MLKKEDPGFKLLKSNSRKMTINGKVKNKLHTTTKGCQKDTALLYIPAKCYSKYIKVLMYPKLLRPVM